MLNWTEILTSNRNSYKNLRSEETCLQESPTWDLRKDKDSREPRF